MVSLTRTNDDGRVTFTLTPGLNGENTVELQYQLLNPSPTFIEVVDEARAVILAGGTMSPISDVVNQLFSHLPPTRWFARDPVEEISSLKLLNRVILLLYLNSVKFYLILQASCQLA